MPPIRPISIQVVVAGFLTAALCTWLAVDFLLDEASLASVTQRPGLRIDAIRTGVTIGIGVGGAVTLLLAARRQWLGERSQAHTEDDALERRATDLYAKAIDQLGSGNVAVRLGGVYALERLARQHTGIRQSIVNVLCAYLRIKLTISSANHDADDGDKERHVRLTVQEVLFGNLRYNDARGRQEAWADIDLNLRGAYLKDVDLSNRQVRSLDMADCHLFGRSNFDSLRVTRNASFEGALFTEDATFFGSVFMEMTNFSSARFEEKVAFIRVSFVGDATFKAAHFLGDCWFTNATFDDDAVFSKAEFHGTADFIDARFHAAMVFFDDIRWVGPAHFNDSYFKGRVHIIQCEFVSDCVFSNARFLDLANFAHGKFLSGAFFGGVEFNGAWFTDAEFAKVACFAGAQVKAVAYFNRCMFENHLILDKSRFDAMLDLSGSHLYRELQTEHATFAAGADFNDALISDVALDTVNDLWPSRWKATRVPHRKDGSCFEINYMRSAHTATEHDH